MIAKLTNVTTIFSNGRPVVVAVLRAEDESILNPSTRLADQLLFVAANNLQLTNSYDVLRIVTINLGFAS